MASNKLTERQEIAYVAQEQEKKGNLHDYQTHILRSVGASLYNTDFNGRQKRIVIGGVCRPRMSSQTQKIMIRAVLEDQGEYRTRVFPQLILSKMNEIDENYRLGEPTLKQYVRDLLITLFSPGIKNSKNLGGLVTTQILNVSEDATAEHAEIILKAAKDFPLTDEDVKDGQNDKNKKYTKKLNDVVDKTIKPELSASASARRLGTSTAMFGQMATTAGFENVYSAVQFAHAYGIDEYAGDYDDFIATDEYLNRFHVAGMDDDNKEEVNGGAAHMNANDIGSSTYYQYACFSEKIYFENLCKGRDFRNPEVVKQIIDKVHADRNKFIELFVTCVPEGHSHPMASMPLPVVVYIAKTHAVQPHTFDETWQKVVEGNRDHSVAEIGTERLLHTIEEHNTGAFAFETADDQYWIGNDNLELPDYLKRVSLTEFETENR